MSVSGRSSLSPAGPANDLPPPLRASLDELAEVGRACARDNWDGFDALAVGPATLGLARRVVESLPAGHPAPSIGAEPDGQVTLEWRRTPSRVLSVSVDPRGLLHYAALHGAAKKSGTLDCAGSIPESLFQFVAEN